MPASQSYLGVGLGNLDYELQSNGVKFFDASAATFAIYGGFWLSLRWAFEASWQLTETSEQPGLASDFPEIAALGLPDTVTAITTANLEIVTLRTLRFVPYRWGSMFTGFGISAASVDSHIDVNDVANGNSVRANPRISRNGLTLAVGAQWNFRRVSLRLGYEWWNHDMRTIALGVHRRL
jgi:hypothetical protein